MMIKVKKDKIAELSKLGYIEVKDGYINALAEDCVVKIKKKTGVMYHAGCADKATTEVFRLLENGYIKYEMLHELT